MRAHLLAYEKIIKGAVTTNFPYWASAVVTGLVSYGYANIFRVFTRFPQTIAVHHPLMMLILTPLSFLVAWYTVHRFAKGAAGSGIPQAMAAGDIDYVGPKIIAVYEYLVGVKTAVVKIISSLIILLGGGAIGREGPTIQVSASIFYFITKKLNHKWSKANIEYCITAGGAAGIASAFNTPLGGIVFAIEELAVAQLNRFRTILISAVIVSGLISQWFSGTYLYLGYPAVPAFKFVQLPLIVFVAVISGPSGAFFGKLLFFFMKFKQKNFTNTTSLALLSLCLGFLMALLIYFGNKYAIGPGNNLVMDVLFKNNQYSHLQNIVERFLGPLISSLSGAAGGIFAPSLATGAAIGQFISFHFAPEWNNLLVLLGMIGFLTGVTRAPFTSSILVLEMTDSHSAIFPMMLTSLIANLCSSFVEPHSFYKNVKEQYLKMFNNEVTGNDSNSVSLNVAQKKIL